VAHPERIRQALFLATFRSRAASIHMPFLSPPPTIMSTFCPPFSWFMEEAGMVLIS
jgi:hypothetical protein